jgi:ATP/maltotriose-dependent transcriptional regulator MalT
MEMRNQALISTKVNIPQLRADVVIRPRVLGILDEGLTRPAGLMLITAPAGYGKTTSLVSWLRKTDELSAWLSLEPEDDLFPRFVTYLIASLQTINSSIGKTIEMNFDATKEVSSQMDVVISGLIKDLSNFAKPVILILEDYHCIRSTDIHKLIEGMVEHIHPHLHLILTTRHDPPLPLARWRARHQLVEIRMHDLQFTSDESAEFFKRAMKLVLSKADIDLLAEQTEGWAAGLQLAALSMRNHKNDSWKMVRMGRHIGEYLMTEVFNQLAPARQEFLLQTSLVSRLNPSLCNLLTGREDSQRMLYALEDDGLFTIALDDARKWFRYHQLFAEFVHQRLLVEYSENKIMDLHQRASHWFGKHGFVLEAIDHALAAKDYKYAGCLIAPQSDLWMRRGEVSTILKYLDQLPREFVWDEWSLCLWYGWTHAIKGHLRRAEMWTDRLEALITPLIQEASIQETATVPSELQNAYAQVLGIRSVIACHKQDFVSAIALGEQALRLVPEDNLNLRTIISAILSSATLEAGDFDQTEAVLQSARQLAYRVGNSYITFNILSNASSLAIMRGQLHRAYGLSMEALRLAQAESLTQLAFLPYLRLGRIHYFWNQLVQARGYIMDAIEHANVSAYPVATVQSYITLSLIQNAEDQYGQALQTLAKAETIGLEHHETESVARVKGIWVQLQLLAGDCESVNHWMKSSGWESFDPSEPGPISNDESFFAFCHYLIDSGKPNEWERVEPLLTWRLMDSEKQKRGSTILRIYLMQARLAQAQDRAEQAMSWLLRALEIAEPENYISPFLMEGRALTPYLRRVPREHVRRKFAQQILSCAASEDPKKHGLTEALSEQEINILQLMAQGHTNPEIARRLVLAVSTVRWYVKQIFRKLGVHNRTQATNQARKLNLL